MMNSLFQKGDLSPFLPKKAMERTLRQKLSENVITHIHNELYEPLKKIVNPLGEGVDAELQTRFGGQATQSYALKIRNALSQIRSLIDNGAKERDLQNALMESGILKTQCKVIQEVNIAASKSHRGMRMDLVFEPDKNAPAEIIELKRGTHLLLARQGKPTERISSQLKKAVKQLQSYGNRIESDVGVIGNIEKRHGLRIESSDLRLIAGRPLSSSSEYHLLYTAAKDKEGLQIQTWDAFLNELERITS